MRRLICTDRVVPLDRLDEYLALWTRVRSAAVSCDMNAWLFRGAGHDDHFREFVEWDGSVAGDAGADRPELERARQDLDEEFGARGTSDWHEVRP